ncbi:MAG: DUF5110 domain-containing protein [Lewinellaceae bacterium]|nr:DUF5110 domain-containing protein [Saprospiraceae bacterium]MCB9313252.1 DUF5110 domain-containing protein [Lewinellaceae bacterium]
MRSILFLLILLSGGYTRAVLAQEVEGRQLIGATDAGSFIYVTCSDGVYRFQAYSTEIMEATFIPIGEAYDSNSHAVVMRPPADLATLTKTPDMITYTTSGIGVQIRREPFQVSYLYRGQVLIEEEQGYHRTMEGDALSFRIREDEVLYGGGARVLGMDRRGHRLQLYNRAHYGYETHSELMNYTLPLVLSSRRYAIHFDNAPIGWLDLDSEGENILTYETISGRKTYQVIAGDQWPDLIDHYTELTGRQPMPPRWTFGNFASRFGYHTEAQTRDVVRRFREARIPLDAVVIDIYWFGDTIFGHMGNLDWLRDSFPDPEGMMADFQEDGVQTILVTEPFILSTSKRWQEAVDSQLLATDRNGAPFRYDFYFGNTGLIDIYRPEARDWFWRIYKHLTEQGVGGWWGDLGEPEVHPSALRHATGKADEVHNIYGHDWAGLVYNGYRRDFPDRRPFILMRAGYSGSQRYGMIPWSGDVSRSWGGLKPQSEIALQMGMQGLAYMHSDLGGFAGGETFDPELYTRWLQYGVFQPVFRPHAQEHIPAEPVFHDKRTRELARSSIEWRYRLLPYNYHLAFLNSQTGIPFMRPLFFEEPENRDLLDRSDAFLWGDAFLVSPVTSPGILEQQVYFPAGSVWYDWHNNNRYTGGVERIVDIVPEHIPVFVRAGSFVPMVEPVQTTRDYSTRSLQVHYFHDETVSRASGSMYDDDGVTPDAHARGRYEQLQFEAKASRKKLTIDMRSEQGTDYQGIDREIDLVIHVVQRMPSRVKVGREKLTPVLDRNQKTLHIPVTLPRAGSVEVQIDF